LNVKRNKLQVVVIPPNMNTAILLSLATLQPVPDTWLDAVEKTESNSRNVWGDGKTAAGIFQFHRAAWTDCSKIRKKAGLPVYPFKDAMDRKKAREYARSWLTYTRARLTKQYGRPANLGETWLAYNLGMRGFSRYNYNWATVDGWRYRKAVVTMLYVEESKIQSDE